MKTRSIISASIIVSIIGITGCEKQEKASAPMVPFQQPVAQQPTYLPPPQVPTQVAPAEPKIDTLSFNLIIDKIAENLAPKVQGKKVTIGSILERQTKTRYQLSDVLTDEIGTAMQNQGVEILVPDKDTTTLKKEWVRLTDSAFTEDAASKIGELVGADVLVIGNFSKWGQDYKVTVQLLDVTNGKILGGTSVTINGDAVPQEMMQPVVDHNALTGTGTASISYQCLDDERPCPPAVELERRAIDVAQMMAMEDLAQKVGVGVSAVQSAVRGRIGEQVVQTNTQQKLINLRFSNPQISGDRVTMMLTSEIQGN
ncbi:MAG: hypothetical protein HQM12_03105 [SAR324 cluster bacterium]|nr:hypothetical protein [SAR324 cluster bacterium]